MMDYKPMAQPMVSNLKKLRETSSDLGQEYPTMYRQLIRSLMYLIHTKSDIFFAVSALSRFICELRHTHWVATKHMLRYLRGSIGYGLIYSYDGGVMLHGYTNSDWEGSTVDRKST